MSGQMTGSESVMTDELISRARAGDAGAFQRLTESHRRELNAHCYRMLGCLQDAEDTLQETLLAARQGFKGFEGRASLRTWLYRYRGSIRFLTAFSTRGRITAGGHDGDLGPRGLPRRRGVPPHRYPRSCGNFSARWRSTSPWSTGTSAAPVRPT
jgi:hypothetical protein